MKFKNGILIQLNNLDVGVVQEEGKLKQLLNVMRDYFQMDGASFLLVGDIGIQKFIAQQVDRLDDIISHEVEITPLSQKDYINMIQKRVEFYRINKNIQLPVKKKFCFIYFKLQVVAYATSLAC